MQQVHFANEGNAPKLAFFPVIKYWSQNNEPFVQEQSCPFDKCLYHSAPIIKLWFVLLFNIRTISSMDIAMQLSFLLHLQWWHYITRLRYNGIVITEDERGGSSLFRLSIWSLISRPWEWAIVERNLYLGTNLLGAPCAIPKFRNVRCYLRRKYGGLNVGTYYILQLRSSIMWSTCLSFIKVNIVVVKRQCLFGMH